MCVCVSSALETARKLPLEQFGSEPHLKLSGIAIALAAVQEDNAKPQQAYDTYVGALEGVRAAIAEGGVSGRERLRAVAIAHKLGEMAEMYQQPEDVEEGWLVYAVEELLRTLRDERNLTRRATDGKEQEEQRAMLDELELPRWVDRMDVVAPLQALGRFYNQRGKQEYVPSLWRAIVADAQLRRQVCCAVVPFSSKCHATARTKVSKRREPMPRYSLFPVRRCRRIH